MSFSYRSIHDCIPYPTLHITAYYNIVGLIDYNVPSDLLSHDEAYGYFTEIQLILTKL